MLPDILLNVENTSKPALVLPNGQVLSFQNKVEGFQSLALHFHQMNISALSAFDVSKRIMELSIPNGLKDFKDADFNGIIGLFGKKVEAEKTGKSQLFICEGCGGHIFFVGPNFVTLQMLHIKEDAEEAIQMAYESDLFGKGDYLSLLEELDKLPFGGTLTPQEFMQRLFTGYEISLRALKK